MPETTSRMVRLIQRLVSLHKISDNSKIVFVDDGSKDRTWSLIEEIAANNKYVSGIKLSRNFGHQNALIAGLYHAEGDVLVSIDADLQDDLQAIAEMLDKYFEGADIVYGVRMQRKTDTLFKRLTAQGFYRLISWLGVESVYNHADYRLMSRRAIECLKQYSEVNLYLRGIIPMLGFKSERVYYSRISRYAGKSKYPLRKAVALAIEAITSFSVVPLRLVTLCGFIIFIGSVSLSFWVLFVKLFTNNAVPGWASIVLPIYFIGGIQIFSIGLLVEYMGKNYIEVKSRPRYFIEKSVK